MKIPKQLPDAIGRREVLYGADTPKELLKAYGDLYLEAERLLDALEFYYRGECEGEIAALRDRARDEGDVFLLLRWEQLSGGTVDEQTWEQAARGAESRGWCAFAAKAFRRAGLEAEARALEEAGAPSSPTAT